MIACWNVLKYLSSITIDELYKDKLIVGGGFVHDEL